MDRSPGRIVTLSADQGRRNFTLGQLHEDRWQVRLRTTNTDENGVRLNKGLQALAKRDRERIRCRNSRMLAGSLALEQALLMALRNAPLWDYAVGIHLQDGRDEVKWIEVHPASHSHLDEVLKKLEWLRDWLRAAAPALAELPREFIWVASGKVMLPPGGQHRRRLAQAGLRFAGERLRLD
ncbi:MAG: hypothetical protein DKINENOH_01465 [bacterium]|nr:hypothetical protein [bacterium]